MTSANDPTIDPARNTAATTAGITAGTMSDRTADDVRLEITRRQVLAGIGVSAAVAAAGVIVPARGSRGATVPAGLAASGTGGVAAASFRPGIGGAVAAPAPGILVLVTLYGGNDGLDMVVPYTNSAYLAGRGDLAVRPEQVLQLDAELGLHPAMIGLKGLWDRKALGIIRGVGYPNPNRSHFRSMDIWQSGVPDRSEVSGWLGRWHDGARPEG